MRKSKSKLKAFTLERPEASAEDLLAAARSAGIRMRGGHPVSMDAVRAAMPKPRKASPPPTTVTVSIIPPLVVEILRDQRLSDTRKVGMLKHYAGLD